MKEYYKTIKNIVKYLKEKGYNIDFSNENQLLCAYLNIFVEKICTEYPDVYTFDNYFFVYDTETQELGVTENDGCYTDKEHIIDSIVWISEEIKTLQIPQCHLDNLEIIRIYIEKE